MRVTKKMLDVFDKAELRRIAIVGMNAKPAIAYTMQQAELVDWIAGRLATEDVPEADRNEEPSVFAFAEADFNSISSDAFRVGVLQYAKALQAYLRGDAAKAPSWPPTAEDQEAAKAAIVETAAKEPEQLSMPSPVDEIPTAEKEAEAGKPILKRRPRKAVAEEKTPDVVQAPAQPVGCNVDLSPVLAKLSELAEMLFALQEDVAKLRGATSEVGDGVLYVVNSLVLDEATPAVSLSELV